MYNKAMLYQNIHSKHRGKLKTKEGVVDIIKGEDANFTSSIASICKIY